MRKVLVFEPNPYHNEVLPGIVKYFEDLEYIADVYVREECYSDDVFCRYKIRGEKHSYRLGDAAEILSAPSIEVYDFVFFSSMEHNENGSIKRFLSELNFVPNAKYGVLGMYHTNWLIDTFEDWELLKEGRLFCISSFQTQEYMNLNWMSPIFFGPHNEAVHVEDKINILMVGNAGNSLDVVNAWWHLGPRTRNKLSIRHIGNVPEKDKSAKGKLYRLYCTLRGIFDYQYRNSDFIIRLGKLTFEEMYSEIEKADYLLLLINPELETDKHYVKYSTSGMRQLSIGFNKPIIIESSVAKIYDLPKKACVFFEKGTLTDALNKAASVEKETYRDFGKGMLQTYTQIYQESMSNLKNAVDKITN